MKRTYCLSLIVVLLTIITCNKTNQPVSSPELLGFSPSVVPGQVSLVLPPNGSTNLFTTLTLSWNKLSGSPYYRLEYATDTVFSQNLKVTDSIKVVVSASKTVSGLLFFQKYYWRVRAFTSEGNGEWSNIRNFTTVATIAGQVTLASPPNNATNIPTTTTLGWNKTGGADYYRIEYSTDPSFIQNVKKVDSIKVLVSPTKKVTGLLDATAYYWRVQGFSSIGSMVWSPVWKFTTVTLPSQVTLIKPINNAFTGSTTVTAQWSRLSNTTYYRLEYAMDSAFTKNLKIIDTIRVVVSPTKIVSGLIKDTMYYWRMRASNGIGSGAWSLTWKFSTKAPIRDYDGNIYTTVQIGTQTWLVENLKTTHYADGTQIPLVMDSIQWNKLTIPGYCWYDNDTHNKEPYGALYNWYVINAGKILISGYHLPSGTEWNTLANYLGGAAISGDKLKETGNAHWLSPNSGTNEVGFFALPGGSRVGNFRGKRYNCYFWSSTAFDSFHALGRSIHDYSSWLFGDNGSDKNSGYYLRLVRD